MCEDHAPIFRDRDPERVDSGVEDLTPMSRRAVLFAGLAGAAFLAGCGGTARSARALPGPAWDASVLDRPRPMPGPPPSGADPRTAAAIPGVIARSAWTSAEPDQSNMDRMLPIRYITVHHDAQATDATNEREVIGILERIRRFHRYNREWADIGYHFAIDRAGRVWEGRPLAWQGAHVKDYNEGNIGVMLLGNFDEQTPSAMQIGVLRDHLTTLRHMFNVPVSRVMTHQEWSPTRCPGLHLQSEMVRMRRTGLLA